MIVFSATEALSPAIERTRRLLFAPFRWGTFLKLCAVAVFTEGFGGNFNFSGPSHSSHHSGNPPSLTATGFSSSTLPTGLSPFSLTPGWIALIVVGVLLAIAISILLFYLITRLRFALFYCLAYQVKEIRPGWTLYREQANRFFVFNLVVGLIFMVLMVLAIAPFAVGLVQVFRSTHAGERFDFALFFSLFIPLFALFFVIVLLAIAVDIVLRDFMLPHFALEDASAGEAWAEVRTRIAAEKGSFFLYAVLRILLPIGAMGEGYAGQRRERTNLLGCDAGSDSARPSSAKPFFEREVRSTKSRIDLRLRAARSQKTCEEHAKSSVPQRARAKTGRSIASS